MPGMSTGIHVTNFWGLAFLLLLWIVLFVCAHILVTFLRHEPLIGWAVGPLGVTVMFFHEPSILYIWLDVLFPALVSGSVLYVGLFTSLSPITLPHHPLFEALVIGLGVCITSVGDAFNALRDLRYPLWGEARILRSIQLLRATWTKIYFTPFGYSYVMDHFGANPAELLQVF